MKSGLAVMLELASTMPDPAIDLTYVLYSCEEVARKYNGLSRLFELRPDLLAGDAAILGEPTGATVEAGCQGVIKLDVILGGERAHTARPWMGINAIHRLAPLLERVAAFESRAPVIDGCQYREALQAVAVGGGVAGNVVPDSARLSLNHRFAPDRSAQQAQSAGRDLIAPALDAELGDQVELIEAAPAAPPTWAIPCWPGWWRWPVGRGGPSWVGPTWRFSPNTAYRPPTSAPATPSVSHTAAERVVRSEIEAVHRAMVGLLTDGVGATPTGGARR